MRRHQTTTLPADRPEQALDRNDIAELPMLTVEQLSPEELRRLIEVSGHPWRPELQDLRHADPGVLRRLAYLARLCCRNRQPHSAVGRGGESVRLEASGEIRSADRLATRTDTRPALRCLRIPQTNIIELTVDGQLGEAEFDDALKILENAIREHGSIRVLKIIRSLGDFPTIPFSRVWEDVRFGWRHFSDVSRAAVVSDLPWLAAMTEVVQPLLKAEVRWFPLSRLEAARAWLRGN